MLTSRSDVVRQLVPQQTRLLQHRRDVVGVDLDPPPGDARRVTVTRRHHRIGDCRGVARSELVDPRGLTRGRRVDEQSAVERELQERRHAVKVVEHLRGQSVHRSGCRCVHHDEQVLLLGDRDRPAGPGPVHGGSLVAGRSGLVRCEQPPVTTPHERVSNVVAHRALVDARQEDVLGHVGREHLVTTVDVGGRQGVGLHLVGDRAHRQPLKVGEVGLLTGHEGRVSRVQRLQERQSVAGRECLGSLVQHRTDGSEVGPVRLRCAVDPAGAIGRPCDVTGSGGTTAAAHREDYGNEDGRRRWGPPPVHPRNISRPPDLATSRGIAQPEPSSDVLPDIDISSTISPGSPDRSTC